MQKKMSLEEMVKLALEKAENAEKKAAEAEMKLAKAETRAQRAEAYMEIKNVWAAHAYCYRAQQQRYEIENFWAKEHDDIMYAHGNMAFVGKETVLNYYAKGNEVMNEGKLKLACELFPDQVENRFHGKYSGSVSKLFRNIGAEILCAWDEFNGTVYFLSTSFFTTDNGPQTTDNQPPEVPT